MTDDEIFASVIESRSTDPVIIHHYLWRARVREGALAEGQDPEPVSYCAGTRAPAASSALTNECARDAPSRGCRR